MKMNALWEIVQTRLVRRGVRGEELQGRRLASRRPAARSAASSTIQQGIPIEAAREIVKFIKDQKLKKVQAAIQADQVRVSSPSKDELQEAMRAAARPRLRRRAAVRQLPMVLTSSTLTSHFSLLLFLLLPLDRRHVLGIELQDPLRQPIGLAIDRQSAPRSAAPPSRCRAARSRGGIVRSSCFELRLDRRRILRLHLQREELASPSARTTRRSRAARG